eukprot:GFYU01001929.1.p1 GENE.GFYU01001929.1~~GFYU01001929.1.p1  ORF type:complete len:440 (-),score=132.43 GFYU01001929.1:15-1334(-)
MGRKYESDDSYSHTESRSESTASPRNVDVKADLEEQTPHVATEEVTSKTKVNVYLLMFAWAFIFVGVSASIATATLLGASLASEKSVASVPFAMLFVGNMCGALLGGTLIQKLGWRLGFCVGCVFGSVGSGLVAIATEFDSFAVACIGFFITGPGLALGLRLRFLAAEMSPPSYKATAISRVILGGVLAAVGGPEIAKGMRTALDTQFTGIYVVLAGVFLCPIILYMFVDYTPATPAANTAEEKPPRPLREIFSDHRVLVAALSAFLSYFLMGFTMGGVPLAMKKDGFDFNDSASVVQYHVLAMFAPALYTGKIIARFGAMEVVTTGCLMMFISVALALTGTEFWNYLVSLLFLGFGWNFQFTGGTALFSSLIQKNEARVAQGVFDFVVFTGAAISFGASGAVVNNEGWNTANWLVLGFNAFGFVASFHLLAKLRTNKA